MQKMRQLWLRFMQECKIEQLLHFLLDNAMSLTYITGMDNNIKEAVTEWAKLQSSYNLYAMNTMNELQAYAVKHDGNLNKELENAGATSLLKTSRKLCCIISEQDLENKDGTEKWLSLNTNTLGEIVLYLETWKRGSYAGRMVFNAQRLELCEEKTIDGIVAAIEKIGEDPVAITEALPILTERLMDAFGKCRAIMRQRTLVA